jgi:EAL domain-containing protein (putative c-di-GMP-specific phosphodiesterase class I)
MKLTHKLGIVYRMEGAKFALMFQSMTGEDATKLYQKIQTMARHSVFVDGEHIPLHISGGAIFVDSPYIGDRSIRTCLTYAQRKSRKELHSELVIFNNEQSNDNMKSLELFETIRQCVLHDCQGFYLCYQPLVRAEDGKVIGMEALLRWKREPYGNLAPGQFIQWLENDDCFFELGNWILRQAMTDGLEIIKDHPDFLVNVNVSYTQLDRSDFQTSLMQIIRETGFPPQNLYLELTERCRTADVDQLREVLDFFVSYGIKIALDDFGTGTASINLLRLLPISCLKIDRTFLTNIQTNKTDEIIVELVIDSANKLGMSVCLEGVENQQLRDYVQKYNVTNHQGYYYSKPIKIHAFREFLENNLLEA